LSSSLFATYPALPFRSRGGGSGPRLLSCGGVSGIGPASPCVQGANASGLAALALSASLAGSMPSVPPARAGVAPTTGTTPLVRARQRSRGSTSIASTFATMHASSRRSRSPWLPRRIGESSNTDAPPDFSRSSTCKSGGFQGSGQRSSVACHSEMALSPGGFSCAGVSDDGDGSGDKVRKKERKTRGSILLASHTW